MVGARWIVLLSLLLMGSAQAAINRCMGLDGVVVYTDRTCESLGAAERPDTGVFASAPIPRRRVGSAGNSRRLVGFGCAANSPEALRSAVVDALDHGDFNALSGLYNFDGRSRQNAAAVVRRLERMAKRTAAEVELIAVETETWFDVPLADTSLMPKLRVVQGSQGGAGPLSIESFTLARSAGCLWLGG